MSDAQWNEVGQKEADEFVPVYGFKEIGQMVVGKYLQQKEVKGGKFGDETHYHFQGKDGIFAVNPNPDLRKRLSVVKVGQICRITLAGEKDVGKESPMKVFKVEVASLPAGASVPSAAATPAAPAKNTEVPF